MKKYLKALIILGSFILVACTNNLETKKETTASDETPVDSVIIEQTPEITPQDTVVAPQESQKLVVEQKVETRQSITKTHAPLHSIEYLMGKFDPNTHPDFIVIEGKYASRGGMTMRRDAYEQFIAMHEAAKQEGINLKIISATRPFAHQKAIWEAKWNGTRAVDGKMLPKEMPPKEKALKILRWSSMPGTSRHHWGTDIDLNDLNNSYFESGEGKKIYEWLVKNAGNYGFCQVYSAKGKARPNGYEEEKWHWSYTPVSKELTALYEEKLTNEAIIGNFEGSESAPLIDIIGNYVLGINPECR